jgi:hypothetical protein
MRKLLSFLLAAVMVFSLAACGDDNSTPSGGANNTGGESSGSSTPGSSKSGELDADIKIIPGKNAMDGLKGDFSVSWVIYTGWSQTLCHIGANRYYCSDRTNDESRRDYEKNVISYSALVSGKYYDWAPIYMKGLEEPKTRLATYIDWDELLEDQLDYDGIDEYCGLSSWLQMSLDWTNGTRHKVQRKHEIDTDMTFVGTEEIAGVMCDVVKLFDWEYAFDPNTGLMFRFTDYREKSNPIRFLVTEYTDSPTELGTYPG